MLKPRSVAMAELDVAQAHGTDDGQEKKDGAEPGSGGGRASQAAVPPASPAPVSRRTDTAQVWWVSTGRGRAPSSSAPKWCRASLPGLGPAKPGWRP